MPEISIIVPVYNVGKYLSLCIESIIRQKFINLELILINDGSKDNSGSICDKYAEIDNRIKVIHNKNQGVSKTRNLGIKLAKGKFIMFCDSDDWVDEDWCKNLYDLQIKNSNSLNLSGLNFINYRTENCKNDNKVFNIKEKTSYIKLKEFYLLYDNQLLNSPCNKIYNKELIDSNNLRFKENLSLGEDLLFNLEYLELVEGNIVVKNECNYNYVLRREESLDNKYYENLFDIYVMLYTKLYEYMIIFGTDFEKYKLKFYDSYFYMLNRVLKNTFHNKSKKNFIEKIHYNSEIIKSDEFKKCLEMSSLNNISSLYRKAYSSQNYLLVYIYEKLSSIKETLRRGI